MSKARFTVQSVGEVTQRGRVVVGDIVDGSVKAGMWVALQGAEGRAWRIAAVEFADNPSRHESHIGLVLAGAPPLQELRELLAPGTVLVVADRPSQ